MTIDQHIEEAKRHAIAFCKGGNLDDINAYIVNFLAQRCANQDEVVQACIIEFTLLLKRTRQLNTEIAGLVPTPDRPVCHCRFIEGDKPGAHNGICNICCFPQLPGGV